MKKCKVISVINWKGGVGKTTLAHHLGTGFFHLTREELKKHLGAEETPRVLLIDNDAQCNLSISCLGVDEYEDLAYRKKLGTIKDLYVPFLVDNEANIDVNSYILKWHVRREGTSSYPTVDLLPSHQDLIYTDMDFASFRKADSQASLMNSDIYKFWVLDKILNRVRKNYDFIFIDCPPNLNYITRNSIYASDYYIIPTILDQLSTYGISSIRNKINELNGMFGGVVTAYQPSQLIGIVPNLVREYKQEPIESQGNIRERLFEMFGDTVFQNYLTYGDGIAGASQMGQPVYSTGAKGKRQSDMLLAILCEMLERVKE